VAFLKGGVGLKILIIVIGVILGIGGISAGAAYHASQQTPQQRQIARIGRITSTSAQGFTMQTRQGNVTVTLTNTTILRFNSKPIVRTTLRPGTIVLVQGYITNGNQSQLQAVHVRLVRAGIGTRLHNYQENILKNQKIAARFII
jgi:Domain of unknown function (DUF5666)